MSALAQWIDETYFNGEMGNGTNLTDEVKQKANEMFAKVKVWMDEKGLAINEENLDKYKEKLDQVIEDAIPDVIEEMLETDGVLTNEQLTKELEQIKKIGFVAFIIILIILIIK